MKQETLGQEPSHLRVGGQRPVQMPAEIQSAHAKCQHAAALISEMLRGGMEMRPKDMVDNAFDIVDEFDKRMQAELDVAAKAAAAQRLAP